MTRFIPRFSYFLSLVSIVGCDVSIPKDNQLSEKERADGWELLFDGTSTDGWHAYRQGKSTSSWEAKDGELFCNPQDTSGTADLVTDKEYENYDFKFDWKLTKEGNSGVFINVLEIQDIPVTWASGPEYQLLENSHADYAIPTKRPGSLYGLVPQKAPVRTMPAGQWNHGRIKQVNGKVEFYLNGTLTAEENFKSEAWFKKVSNSGFKAFPRFGRSTKGRIALQDWTTGVSFKNLKIKKL